MPALRTLPRFTKALVMRNTLTLHPRLSTAALAMALLAPIASQAEAQKIQFDIGAQSCPAPCASSASRASCRCFTAPMKCKACAATRSAAN